MVWTRFMDMHSGGDLKIPPYEYIYIETSEREAVDIFYKLFNRNPYYETCSCCGGDFSIEEFSSMEALMKYEMLGSKTENFLEHRERLFIDSLKINDEDYKVVI